MSRLGKSVGYWVLVLVYFCGGWLSGQDLNYRALSKSDGLPSNDVYAIFQDSRGFIWLTHERGLSRYDGYEFRNYEARQQTSRAGTGVREDSRGRIWYQNFDGRLYYVSGDSLAALPGQNTPLGYFQYGLDGRYIYVLQAAGLDVFDVNTLELVRTVAFEKPELSVRTHLVGGRYYIINQWGIYELQADWSWKVYGHGAQFALPRVVPFFMIEAAGGEIILFEREQVTGWCYELGDSSYGRKFRLPTGLMLQNGLYVDSTYWFCGSAGLYGFDGSGRSISGGRPFLGGMDVSCIIKDREGNYWVGTKGNGALLIQDIKSRRMYGELACHRLFGLDSLLYVGGMSEDLYEVNAGFERRLLYKGGSRHAIEVMAYDSIAGRLLVQGQKYMQLTRGGELRSSWAVAVKSAIRLDERFTACAVSGTFGLYEDSTRRGPSIWSGWYERHKAAGGVITSYLISGCRGRAVCHERERGRLLFASSHGLWEVRPDTSFEIKQGGRSLYIERLCLYAGRVYASDNIGGLFVLGDSLRAVGLPLPNTRVKNMKVFGDKLFILSEDALFLMDSAGGLKQLHLHSQEFSDFCLFGGRLVLATNRGLILQELIGVDERPLQPIFYIASMKANDEQIDTSDIQLAHYQNDIEIRYHILSFKTNGRYPLYYQINGGAWQLAAPETRSLRLPALAFGDYAIKFRLGDKAAASLRFRILPPWWRQWWFILSSAGVAAALLYAYFRQQTNMLRRQNALLTDKVALERDLNRSTLKAIKSQMNPHFLYNALNSIQAQILADDKKTALLYLNKFTRLSRLILDMSEADLVSLEEEIKALRLYLDLEKARFDGQDFEYHFELPEDLDARIYWLPAMLIQPYVENAIKHGLLHSQGPKRLDIRFALAAQQLLVEIRDNGVGRARSAEINKNRQGHTSFATQANQKRLHILAANATYTDHHDPTGTTVALHIPLEIDEHR